VTLAAGIALLASVGVSVTACFRVCKSVCRAKIEKIHQQIIYVVTVVVVVVVVVVVEMSIIALLLQDHRTMSTKSVCSSQ